MAYKGIRTVGVMSVLMGAAWLAALIWATFGTVAPAERSVIQLVGQGFLLVFLLLGWLASHASTVLERQADQVALLQREVADLKLAGSSDRRAD